MTRRTRSWSTRPPTTRRLLLSLFGALILTLTVVLHRYGPQRSPVATASLPSSAVVARVIDGDTVELADGRRVRYLGIDTPELRKRVGQSWVYAPEPFAEAAAAANRTLVEGRTVRLEYDARPYDRYNRLLAYIYVGETFVNAELLARGLARVLIIPPNVRHAEECEALQRQARQQRAGMWGR